ncbi:sensor histidine kinase, partial [Roseateles sp. GG27B]
MSATPAHRQDRENSSKHLSSQSHTHADRPNPDIAAAVKSAQIAALYERAVQPALLSWGFSLFPLIALWVHLPFGLLLGWFAARSLVSALRCADAWQFHQFLAKAPSDAATAAWLNRFLALLALDAILWGVMGLFFHAASAADLEGLLLAAMLGVSGVGLLTLGARFQAGLLFGSLTLMPLAAYQFSLGSQVAAWTGLGLMLFLVMALAESRRIAQRTTALLRQHFADAWLSQQRQQALQSAEQSNTSKSRFVAVMSHEIRTPLNGILGMTQLLERSELNSQQREQIDIVRRSGRHLLALVNDILDLARIESGKLAVDAGPVNVRETLDDVCGLLGLSAREKGLGFTLSLNPALPLWVLGDSSRIKQVLHNLIGNAIKFTVRGQVA